MDLEKLTLVLERVALLHVQLLEIEPADTGGSFVGMKGRRHDDTCPPICFQELCVPLEEDAESILLANRSLSVDLNHLKGIEFTESILDRAKVRQISLVSGLDAYIR